MIPHSVKLRKSFPNPGPLCSGMGTTVHSREGREQREGREGDRGFAFAELREAGAREQSGATLVVFA